MDGSGSTKSPGVGHRFLCFHQLEQAFEGMWSPLDLLCDLLFFNSALPQEFFV